MESSTKEPRTGNTDREGDESPVSKKAPHPGGGRLTDHKGRANCSCGEEEQEYHPESDPKFVESGEAADRQGDLAARATSDHETGHRHYFPGVDGTVTWRLGPEG